MLATIHSSCLVGVQAVPVEVEVQLSRGLPGLDLVGLPERGVRESRIRVQAALDALGYRLPPRRFVLNLAPADLRKSGSAFDLAISVGILAACDLVSADQLSDTLFVGELSLTGEIRSVPGVLAHLSSAVKNGVRRAVVPARNSLEANLVHGIEVFCAQHLRDVVDHLDGRTELPRAVHKKIFTNEPRNAQVDLSEVRGQDTARRALEIAAAGNHHVLLVGPPGAGKSMLAQRFGTILPEPTHDESLELHLIASVGGFLSEASLLMRPFRAPHHTCSTAALIGGGDPVKPGEVTFAHHGVLFLDEFPEFRRDAIESLRVIMETGYASVARVHSRVRLPASPLVIAAMNPCPCGYYGEKRRICSCAPSQIERYRARISKALLDRFDLQVWVPRLPTSRLRSALPSPSSGEVQNRVSRAIRFALLQNTGPFQGKAEELIRMTHHQALSWLDAASERFQWSTRAYVKVLRVARTIANLRESVEVQLSDVAEATQYRVLDEATRDDSRTSSEVTKETLM